MDGERSLYVISHTHWDREWYQTFQQYRRRLVFLLDEVIEQLEADAEYRFFHLDGQTVLLEDYLEIRPEARQRLERLIRDGRIIVGPWYVMPDGYLVSGESLVRNLQRGRALAREFGAEPMTVGYVVDVFGHAAQMPQLFRGFGLDSAVLFRGIGDYPRDLFRWVGPDGSEVLTAKLDPDRCYSNFYFALRWPFDGREYDEGEFVRRAGELFEMMDGRAVSRHLLLMDGVDHIEIEPELPRLLDILRKRFAGTTVHHARLEQYFAAQREAIASGDLAVDAVERLSGRLYHIGRRGLNNRVLKNTLSSMVHLKQANDQCETLLTRFVEPFLCLLPPTRADGYHGFLREAWRYVLQNHPHDSICGCSITAVHQDNEHRFKQAREIAEEVLASIHRDLLPATITPRPVGHATLRVYNAGQSPFEGLIEAELMLVPELGENVRIYDHNGDAIPCQVLRADHNAMEVQTAVRRLPSFIRSTAMKLVFKASVPPVGYADYDYEQLPSRPPAHGEYAFTGFSPPSRPQGTMRRAPGVWETDYFVVRTCPGGLSLTDKRSGRTLSPLFSFEDCGDVGDGWNYVPPSGGDERHTTDGATAQVIVESDGPLALRLRIEHEMSLPTAIDGARRGSARSPLRISTTVTMVKDRQLLSIHIELTNTCTDHRLRLLVPTPFETREFHHATPFGLDRSEVGREDDTDSVELETGVLPNQGVLVFADAKGTMGFYNRGLYEFEVIDGEELTAAITLLRSFASETGRPRGEMSLLLRPLEFDCALDFGDASATPNQMLVRGMDWRCGLRCFSGARHAGGAGAGGRLATSGERGVTAPANRSASSGSVIRIDGSAVLSSIRPVTGGGVIVRLYNPSQEATAVDLRFERPVTAATPLLPDEETPDPEAKVEIVDDGRVRVSLRPAGIGTIVVHAATSPIATP